METSKSLERIESMFLESKKSLRKNSFFFILWGVLMAGSGLAEYFLFGNPYYWIVWPIVGALGGIVSSIQGARMDKNIGIRTAEDRIMAFTWGGFIFSLIICIVFAITQGIAPAPLVLILASYATFISGGISKFKPLYWGSLFLIVGGIVCGFILPVETHGLVFAISILFGYVYPGIKLMQSENAQT